LQLLSLPRVAGISATRGSEKRMDHVHTGLLARASHHIYFTSTLNLSVVSAQNRTGQRNDIVQHRSGKLQTRLQRGSINEYNVDCVFDMCIIIYAVLKLLSFRGAFYLGYNNHDTL